MALVTIYMHQTLKTGPYFFHKELNYQLKMFLFDFGLNKVAKIWHFFANLGTLTMIIGPKHILSS